MYVNYNLKTLELQQRASETKTAGGKTISRNVDVRIDYKNIEIKTADSAGKKTKTDSYITEKEAGSLEEYIKKSVSGILEKISSYTENTLRTQSDTVLANVQMMSVSIEISVQSETADTNGTVNSLIGEDGYFGIEKTSQRLFELAKILAGDDTEKLKKAKDAITKGYESVAGLFGGDAPDITHKTYNRTMEKMDGYIEHLNRESEKHYV